MDAPLKKSKTKEEPRVLLRKCFRNFLYALVPYDVWKNLIFAQVHIKTLGAVTQLSQGSKCAVEEIRKNNMVLAKRYRREGQIPMALKCLQSSAECNNPEALFELGWAYSNGGWGVKKDSIMSIAYHEKAYKLGNAMAILSYASYYHPIMQNEAYHVDWYAKAFNSDDNYVRGYCYFYGLGTKRDYKKAMSCLLTAALQEDNMYAQFLLGSEQEYYNEALAVDVSISEELEDIMEDSSHKTAFSWYAKAAEQGLYSAQRKMAHLYRVGNGCHKDLKLALMWHKKAEAQEYKEFF